MYGDEPLLCEAKVIVIIFPYLPSAQEIQMSCALADSVVGTH